MDRPQCPIAELGHNAQLGWNNLTSFDDRLFTLDDRISLKAAQSPSALVVFSIYCTLTLSNNIITQFTPLVQYESLVLHSPMLFRKFLLTFLYM